MPHAIVELARAMLRDPVKVAATATGSTVAGIEQRIVRVERAAKAAMLADILKRETIDRALVFTRTKHGADRVVRSLGKAGIAAQAIHGNKSQNQRNRVLADFRKGEVRTLVATDIAARGIDVDGISHVVNFELPNVPETYVHRIGRTARAGAKGVAISLCDAEEAALLRDIEKLIRLSIPTTDHSSLRYDYEKRVPVFGKRSCSDKEVARDNGSERNHPALARQRPQSAKQSRSMRPHARALAKQHGETKPRRQDRHEQQRNAPGSLPAFLLRNVRIKTVQEKADPMRFKRNEQSERR
jgi:superfamily II DNA/RNA helicase